MLALFPLLLTHAAPPARAVEDALVARLRTLTLLNEAAILEEAGLLSGPTAPDFRLANPYDPLYGEAVAAWWALRPVDTTVCAVEMAPEGTAYRLHTHPSQVAAEAAGHTVTHRHRCGACSSLQDLSVYLSTPDLTAPARRCARRLGSTARKACLASLGFTASCAEIWAYNAAHTRQSCLGDCVEAYGLWGVATGRMRAPDNLPDGRLNACLACDERYSGPGFQYAAGRTRRSAGLHSSIQREPTEIYPLDHSRYWAPEPAQPVTNGERNADGDGL